MHGRRLIFRMLFVMLGVAVICFMVPGYLAAETESAGAALKNGALSGTDRAMMSFAAVLAVGLSCITSAYALAKIGAAAMGAMSEKPEIGGRALVFLGMAEGIAIYGLIIAIMILNKL